MTVGSTSVKVKLKGTEEGKEKTTIVPSTQAFIELVQQKVLEENNIQYQIGELGKVDVGGGGTIAYILANKGVDVLDCGVPVLSMHAPYEVTSKYDVYQAYKGYEAFFKS